MPHNLAIRRSLLCSLLFTSVVRDINGQWLPSDTECYGTVSTPLCLSDTIEVSTSNANAYITQICLNHGGGLDEINAVESVHWSDGSSNDTVMGDTSKAGSTSECTTSLGIGECIDSVWVSYGSRLSELQFYTNFNTTIPSSYTYGGGGSTEFVAQGDANTCLSKLKVRPGNSGNNGLSIKQMALYFEITVLTTAAPTTATPTTTTPTTATPTTVAPTTAAPTTATPTTVTPTTATPTTAAPTTSGALTTVTPTTATPTTATPTTAAPTTAAPTTSGAPTTVTPTTVTPTTATPTSAAPTTAAPTTATPTTIAPTTAAPTTLTPTLSPVTTQPTSSPVIDVGSVAANVSVWWSCSYLQLYIDANTAVDLADIDALTDNICSEIFDANTADLLGSSAVCTWTLADNRLITVSLASDSSINAEDSMMIQSGVFSYAEQVLSSAIQIDAIERECPETAPILNFQPPTAIGVCDDLLLDIRGHSIANLGGRPAASIRWDISFNDGQQNQSLTVDDALYVSVASKNMSAGHSMYVTLSITSWYNRSASVTGAVYKSNQAVPSIQLTFPAIFDAHTSAVNIESGIAFVDSCLNATQSSSSSSPSSFFLYSWDVQFVSELSTVPIKSGLFAALQELAHAQSGRTLSIADVDSYLQKGAAYAFTLSIACDTSASGYECSAVSTPAVVRYQFSPIVCQISGGNRAWTVSESATAELSVSLLGDEWSFDPDGDALSFEWRCHERIGDQDCSPLLTSPLSAQSVLSFENTSFAVNASYEFEISLIVADASVLSRAQCTDSVTLVLDVVGDDDDDAHVMSYSVSISATSSSISSSDRLRLIASVSMLNGEALSDDSHLTYEWSTKTDKLSVDEINTYRLNAPNAKNLVLNGEVLQTGAMHEFVLTVYDSASTSPESVGSASIAIYVRSPPVISSPGFTIDDGTACNISFSDLTESLLRPFTLYVSADGDETPLTYAFEAVLPSSPSHRLHSQVLYQPVLDRVLLPIECQYSLAVTVTDFENSQASQSIDCCVSVSNHDCFSYSAVVETYFGGDASLLSDSQKHRFVLQSAFNVLHYLSNIGDDDECKRNLFFDEIIGGLSELFSSDAIDFCAPNNFVFVVEMAQTLTKWLSVGMELSLFNNSSDCSHFDIIYDLFTQALDPCETIREEIADSNQLQVSPQSVLSNEIIVLYQGRDITQQLSLLLTQQQHLPGVYNLIDAFVDYLSVESLHSCLPSPPQPILNFLESVLYISGLSGISTTIPSEVISIKSNNFEVLTIRGDALESLNVTVKDIEIELGIGNGDIDDNNNQQNRDVIIYGLQHKPEQGTSFASDADDNCFETTNGTLDEQQVSITVVNSTSETDIDVTMTFEFDGDYDNAVCVWWDESNGEWSSAGCYALIDISRNVMICHCDHLTTFATISNLKTRRDNGCGSDDTIHTALSPEYSEVMFAFSIAFLVIFCWIVFNCCRLKLRGVLLKSMIKHRSMQVLLLTAFVAIFYAMQCMMFYLQLEMLPAAQVVLIIFLLLPLILYYLIFSFVVGTWMNVVHSMAKSESVSRFKKFLRWFTVVVCLVYSAMIVLLIAFDENTEAGLSRVANIIKIGELFWVSIMALSVLLFTLYGARVVSTIYNANKAFKDVATQSALRRISAAVVGLNIFFLCEGAQTVFFSFYPERLTRYWQFGNLAQHLACLILICCLYAKAWNALLNDGEILGSSERASHKNNKVGSRSGNSEKSERSEKSVTTATMGHAVSMTPYRGRRSERFDAATDFGSPSSFPFPVSVPALATLQMQPVQSASFDVDQIQLSPSPAAASALCVTTPSMLIDGETPNIAFYGANRFVSGVKTKSVVVADASPTSLWKAYLDENDGREPVNELQMETFLTSTGLAPNMSFHDIRAMYGKLKGTQIENDEDDDAHDEYEYYYEDEEEEY